LAPLFSLHILFIGMVLYLLMSGLCFFSFQF